MADFALKRHFYIKTALPMQDRDVLAKYMGLSVADRKTAGDVVAALALALAASVKARAF